MVDIGRVLVIDDNAENRLLAHATMEDADIPCSVAATGDEGIAMFASVAPTCILLDIRMPAPDGIEVCRRIRASPGGDRVAIVFLTAERSVEVFDRALSAGGDDFVTKPFDTAELVARVRTAVRLRRIAAAHDDLAVQLKRQRDELKRLQLHKEQLSQFLVHDFKNPVNSIVLQAQRIARDPNATQRSLDAAVRIGGEAAMLLRMITNLLDLGKADEGRLAPARSTVDLPAFIASIIAELEPRAAAAEIEIVDETAASDVTFDEDLVRRVMANLVENAIRHAPQASRIVVTSRTDADGLELVVADEGIGIPEPQRATVFERFVSSGTDRSNRGLGLSFCRVAIEAHGGRIWVEDNEPGARFRLFIPR
ncbi:MAG: hybrid sensor histidine kinase/response regulator [Kofleriaceae bacterium]